MKFITIFTPTYNRAGTLIRLYESLKKQTNKNFLWLIVDDGSTDNTEEIVNKWISDDELEIRYFKQQNQGKSMAHNKGVELTETELFTCVDSDDYLTDNAVEEIINCWKVATANNIGILAFKTSETAIITKLAKRPIDENGYVNSTLGNAYRNLGLVGDTMLIFRTNILAKFKFPYIPGEKFVPEAYLYDLIDREGKLIFLEKSIYICEYLEDGYTKNMAKLIKNNPRGYIVYIKQRLRFDNNIRDKIFDTIRYVAIAIVNKEKKIIKDSVYPLITLLVYPLGVLFYIKRYKGI